MNEENLIPMDKRPPEEARLLSQKGGQTMTEARELALLINASHKAKCKSCPAICILKEANLAKDPDHYCTVPEGRGRAIYFNMPVMSRDILIKISHENMLRIAKEAKTAKDRKILHDVLKDKLGYEHPAVIQMVNTNVNIDVEGLFKEWFDEEKEEKEEKR